MQKTIIITSDHHSGSLVGLAPRGVDLQGGGTYRLNRGQSWLLDCWQNFIDRVSVLPNPVVIFNGDACDLDMKQRTYELITRNKATVLQIARDNLEPLCKLSDQYYFVRGTPAHTGKSSWSEEELGNDLGAVQNGEEYSWSRLYLNVDGVRIDIAHHATLSGLPYGVVGSAERLAAKMVLQYHDSGERPPDLVIRSHNHKWADSGDDHRTRAIYTGAWCLPGEHAQKLGYDLADVGALIIHCDGGKYEVEKMKFIPRGRVWQKL